MLPSVPCIKFLGMLLMGGQRSTVVVTCHFDVQYLQMRDAWGINWSLVTGSELSADKYRACSHQLANAGRFCKGNKSL